MEVHISNFGKLLHFLFLFSVNQPTLNLIPGTGIFTPIMNQLGNYITGSWVPSEADGTPLFNAVTGDVVAVATKQKLDFESILAYGRQKGGPVLRKMTFQQRGEMLKKLAMYLTKRKEAY